MLPYIFAKPLCVGRIVARPNRFVMMVEKGGEMLRCHCPATGCIAYLDFEKSNIPCLLSENTAKTAKTSHTVEAISLDVSKTIDSNTEWFGINQNRANRIVEHFLEQGGLFGGLVPAKVEELELLDQNRSQAGDHSIPEVESKRQDDETIGKGGNEPRAKKKMKKAKKVVVRVQKGIQREVTLGESKLDFCLVKSGGVKHFIEVKSPLNWVETEGHPNYNGSKKFQVTHLSERLTRHFTTLAEAVSSSAGCSILIMFMYDAKPFIPPRTEDCPKRYRERLDEVIAVVDKARSSGVQEWQLNVRFTPEKVDLVRHFQLHPVVKDKETIAQDKEAVEVEKEIEIIPEKKKRRRNVKSLNL